VLPALGDDQPGNISFYNSVLSHGDFGKDIESFEKPIQNKIDFSEYEERARNGSSYQKVMSDSLRFRNLN